MCQWTLKLRLGRAASLQRSPSAYLILWKFLGQFEVVLAWSHFTVPVLIEFETHDQHTNVRPSSRRWPTPGKEGRTQDTSKQHAAQPVPNGKLGAKKIESNLGTLPAQQLQCLILNFGQVCMRPCLEFNIKLILESSSCVLDKWLVGNWSAFWKCQSSYSMPSSGLLYMQQA